MKTGGKLIHMSGIHANEGHAWVCDGARENYSDTKYYLEFIDWMDNYFVPSSNWTMDNPGSIYAIGGSYFHLNWGNGDTNENGWYFSSTTSSSVLNANYKYDRRNIYPQP